MASWAPSSQLLAIATFQVKSNCSGSTQVKAPTCRFTLLTLGCWGRWPSLQLCIESTRARVMSTSCMALPPGLIDLEVAGRRDPTRQRPAR